jgi:hypothetical protein
LSCCDSICCVILHCSSACCVGAQSVASGMAKFFSSLALDLQVGGEFAMFCHVLSCYVSVRPGQFSAAWHWTCRWGRSDMLCYIMLCYIMLCYVTLVQVHVALGPTSCSKAVLQQPRTGPAGGEACHVMLCYVVTRYIMSYYVRYIMKTCYVRLGHFAHVRSALGPISCIEAVLQHPGTGPASGMLAALACHVCMMLC